VSAKKESARERECKRKRAQEKESTREREHKREKAQEKESTREKMPPKSSSTTPKKRTPQSKASIMFRRIMKSRETAMQQQRNKITEKTKSDTITANKIKKIKALIQAEKGKEVKSTQTNKLLLELEVRVSDLQKEHEQSIAELQNIRKSFENLMETTATDSKMLEGNVATMMVTMNHQQQQPGTDDQRKLISSMFGLYKLSTGPIDLIFKRGRGKKTA